MKKESIKDQSDNTISSLKDHKELGTEQVLNHKKSMVNAPVNPLDWYALIESANSILNELIAYTGRERYAELQKDVPDQDRICTLRFLSKKLKSINRNSDNFRDGDCLKRIIASYGPLIKKVNNGEQPV